MLCVSLARVVTSLFAHGAADILSHAMYRTDTHNRVWKNIITSANRPIDRTLFASCHVLYARALVPVLYSRSIRISPHYSCSSVRLVIQIARMDLMLKSRDRNAVLLTQNSPSTTA